MKKIVMLAVVGMFVAVSAASSFAANSWDTCGVERLGLAGATDNLVKVNSCGVAANNGKWLQLVQQQDAGLATLLTAVSLTKKVKINADFATATTNGSAYGAIEVIYLDQ